jgi:hypothetical protein
MGDFDQASKQALKLDPAAFFAWTLPRFVNRFVFLGWRDTTTIAFPGEPDRICDTVAEFGPREGDEPHRLADVEAQTEPDPDILERLGEYAFRLRREIRHGQGRAGKYRVFSVLLTLTGPEQPATLDLREPDLDGAGIALRVVQVLMREQDAAAILARVAAGELGRAVLPWLPLMRGADNPAIIAEWVRLALGEPDEQRRGPFGSLARVFADCADRLSSWGPALEGWNMQRSVVVEGWRREGAISNAKRNVLRALELRFGVVPEDVAARVNALIDLAELDRWFDFAHTAASLDAFRAAIQPPAANGVPAS